MVLGGETALAHVRGAKRAIMKAIVFIISNILNIYKK
jgi:hypothetical protein